MEWSKIEEPWQAPDVNDVKGMSDNIKLGNCQQELHLDQFPQKYFPITNHKYDCEIRIIKTIYMTRITLDSRLEAYSPTNPTSNKSPPFSGFTNYTYQRPSSRNPRRWSWTTAKKDSSIINYSHGGSPAADASIEEGWRPCLQWSEWRNWKSSHVIKI